MSEGYEGWSISRPAVSDSRPGSTDEHPLVKQMFQLARSKPRYGYHRIGWFLRKEGWRAGVVSSVSARSAEVEAELPAREGG